MFSVRLADEAPKASQGIPAKLTLNLLAPHKAIYSKAEVDQVITSARRDGWIKLLPGCCCGGDMLFRETAGIIELIIGWSFAGDRPWC